MTARGRGNRLTKVNLQVVGLSVPSAADIMVVNAGEQWEPVSDVARWITQLVTVLDRSKGLVVIHGHAITVERRDISERIVLSCHPGQARAEERLAAGSEPRTDFSTARL